MGDGVPQVYVTYKDKAEGVRKNAALLGGDHHVNSYSAGVGKRASEMMIAPWVQHKYSTVAAPLIAIFDLYDPYVV